MAKVGGLADVVGALPKYQNQMGATCSVIMPFYNNSFTQSNSFETIYRDEIEIGNEIFEFSIKRLENTTLGFNLFFVDIREFLFKEYIYSHDDTKRFLSFQIATLDWLSALKDKPDIVHIHDHHTGLIPFMMTQSFKYNNLKEIPTVLTIHNAQYQGWFSHNYIYLIPPFDFSKVGLLDWDSQVNPLAAAIKCAWRVTTVSPSYMQELKENANGLEHLLKHETKKCIGILNGIDWNEWNAETDSKLEENYTLNSIEKGKKINKKWLCNEFDLDINKPLFAFIGRLVNDKGADLLPSIFIEALKKNDISILLLGSGNIDLENELNKIENKNYNHFIGYNEKLAHVIYAGADFLLMPSRVEPCGLNQMYALRYGTIPIVNKIGGLKDTIVDISLKNGFGIIHEGVNTTIVVSAIERAKALYFEKNKINTNRKKIMQINHSWNKSASDYIELYKKLNN